MPPREMENQMTPKTALIIGNSTSTTQELDRALKRADFEVRQAGPENHVGLQPDPDSRPDMLLVSAALGLQRVALLSERYAVAGRLPTTVVFPEGGLAELEVCVRGGFDYVTPPFAPNMLRMRLTSCWERGQLTLAVEEMANAASLYSYERDLNIAREIQNGFLPEELPTPEGWEVAARFRPASLVAGDFYDVFELAGGRRLATIVADVCDKGVGAALFMALIRTMLRHTAEQAGGWYLSTDQLPQMTGTADLTVQPLGPVLSVGAGPLLQAVSGTNSYMARHHQRQGYFCTMFFAVLEPRTGGLLYVNGGHNPAVLVRMDGHHTLLAPTGPAVGMFPNSTYLVAYASLQPGDTLFMYTDGVTEARSPGGAFFGTDRMLELVVDNRGSSAGLIEAVDSAVRAYTGSAQQHDDITMLALHRPA
jgi:phosphoserine phosphatase RsbU/P